MMPKFILFHFVLLLLLTSNFSNAFEHQPNWQEFKHKGSITAIDYSKYLTKVATRLVEIFEETHVSGVNLPILDQSVDIKESVLGFSVEGTDILYDGFVNKMEKIVDNHHNHKVQWGEQACTLESPLHIYNVSIVYDVLYKFKDHEGGSTFIITFDEIELSYKISQHLKTKVVTTSMELKMITCEKENGRFFTTVAHPFDKYAQMALLGLEKSGNKKFCENIRKSIQRWKLHECLQQAVDEIGFVTVCYYC